MQHNFILTDLMKTGGHQSLEEFINMNTLEDQHFEMTGEYYTLHNYDLDRYDRKIAFIERSIVSKLHPAHNPAFREELNNRMSLLHSQGFKFIYTTPFESKENMSQLELFPKYEESQMVWDGGVTWFWFYMFQKHNDTLFDVEHSNKTYDFLYLNKQKRPHRKMLFDRMYKKHLLDGSLFSFHQYSDDTKFFLPRKYETNYPFKGQDYEMDLRIYEDSKYSLIAETNDNNDDIFMTEKIWKPIIAKHIFVVHGNYLYLQKLKELGFKTFSKYFDESYDIEIDRYKRIDKIVQLCNDLLRMNWKDLYLQTQSIRQHNFDLFFNKEQLSERINEKINLFLEFVDRS